MGFEEGYNRGWTEGAENAEESAYAEGYNQGKAYGGQIASSGMYTTGKTVYAYVVTRGGGNWSGSRTVN